jgi:His/Glu/Gln/Arg/opine family amino acid ABC transporter permease subunit
MLGLPDWFRPVAEYMLREGLPETLRLAAISVVASTVVGIVLGVLMTIRFRPSQWLIRLYIEVWRGLPIIVTIFIIFFVSPVIGSQFEFDPFTSATIGLSLWGSAQIAEAARGAVESIPREQHEAAAALGFGWVGRHVFVIVPQALRRLLPPLVTLLVGIIQNSTLAAVIGATELLSSAQQSIERLGSPITGTGESHAFAILGAVMVVFFLISFPLTRLAAFLEHRLVA